MAWIVLYCPPVGKLDKVKTFLERKKLISISNIGVQKYRQKEVKRTKGYFFPSVFRNKLTLNKESLSKAF